jgi:hypothetical protein
MMIRYIVGYVEVEELTAIKENHTVSTRIYENLC